GSGWPMVCGMTGGTLALACFLQRPLAVVEAPQNSRFTQFIELERDLAAVPAADQIHDLGKMERPGFQRLPCVLIARRLVADAAREGAPALDRVGPADRTGEIEADFGDGAL